MVGLCLLLLDLFVVVFCLLLGLTCWVCVVYGGVRFVVYVLIWLIICCLGCFVWLDWCFVGT